MTHPYLNFTNTEIIYIVYRYECMWQNEKDVPGNENHENSEQDCFQGERRGKKMVSTDSVNFYHITKKKKKVSRENIVKYQDAEN